jgi:Fe2+ or Zn2+ uptake regulation protein
VYDVDPDAINPVTLRSRLPEGFQLQRCAVELQVVCARCTSKAKRNPKNHS